MAVALQRCSDEELARESQAGSLAAFEELVYRYEGRIYGFALNSCRNATAAREVTQDVFVRAFQAIGGFDCRRQFGPWLFAIARRKCIDRYRGAPSVAGEPMPEPQDHDDPAELLARREERQDLWSLARRRLPEPQYQALWLKYAEEMSVAAIAQVLGKTQTHVKVLLFRARRTLARALSAVGAAEAPLSQPVAQSAMEPNGAFPGIASAQTRRRTSRSVEVRCDVVGLEPRGARKGSV